MKVYVAMPLNGFQIVRIFKNKQSLDDFLSSDDNKSDWYTNICEVEVSEDYKQQVEKRKQKALQRKEEKSDHWKEELRRRKLDGRITK